jgi:hypothetical protein
MSGRNLVKIKDDGDIWVDTGRTTARLLNYNIPELTNVQFAWLYETCRELADEAHRRGYEEAMRSVRSTLSHMKRKLKAAEGGDK